MSAEAAPPSSRTERGFSSGVLSKTSRDDPAAHGSFGIKAKLFLALSLLAGLTAGASGVAWYVFVDIGRSVARVTDESLPGMVSALSLAKKSAEIAVTAPALMASRSQEERVAEQVRLSQRTGDLASLIQDLGSKQVAPAVTERLVTLGTELTATLEALNGAIERRLRFKGKREMRMTELAAMHARFLTAIEPLVDDSVFDLVISVEKVTAQSTRAITDLVEGGVRRFDLLLTINAEANLAAGLLGEAVHVDDAALIQPIRERFDSASAAVERGLNQLPDELADGQLRADVDTLLGFGKGEHSVFAQRMRELRATDEPERGGQQDRREANLKGAHERLLLTLTPLIDDAAFDLVLKTEGVTKQSRGAITDLIDVGAHALHVLLTLRAEVNLAAGLLNQAAVAPDMRLLQPFRERFDAAEGHILRMLGGLRPQIDTGEVSVLATGLLDLGKADDGLFELRRTELRHVARAQSAVDKSRALTVRLGDEVAQLVAAARNQSRAAAARSAETITGGKLVMMILTATSVGGAAVVMLYYVGPGIISPLESITRAMTGLAAGDTSIDIPGRDRADELGRMAQALGVFRDTAIEVQESNLREIRETRRRLSDAIESISEAFSLYDSDDRLVVCNSKYRSLLYPGIADEIVPGMSFEDIVRRAIKRGYIKDAQDDPETWLAGRLARHRQPSGPHIQQRGDGRWILVSERKTEDGGTVAVYSDITELKQREEELAEKSNALEQLSNQLAKYLSPQVYESIFTGRQEVKVASQRKKLTVFFSDIAGFTETADHLESEELTQLLNHYLTEMSQIALDHGARSTSMLGTPSSSSLAIPNPEE
jgi:HAMP domain-containing protein